MGHHECCWLRLHVARYRLPLSAPPDPSTIRHARGASSNGVQVEAQPGLRGATSMGMSLEVVLDQVIRCSHLRAHCNLS
jgi:hypothetical protein